MIAALKIIQRYLHKFRYQVVGHCLYLLYNIPFMLRPYVLTIFRELQMWSTCSVYGNLSQMI